MSLAEPALRPVPSAPVDALPEPILRELRSDHAGELGAVWIYHGVLAIARDPELRAFAEAHRRAEQAHLDFFLSELPSRWQSRLAPLWRLAGFVLGALPALVGTHAVYRTVAAVEAFVDEHYRVQIDMLEAHPGHAWLRERLVAFRADELHHRDDAAARVGADALDGLWARIVMGGSAAGAELARRV
ncbi:MAG: demethoxyubiquinone hydroxylase family protein [Pseudomonadales bacterium]|nr:demethoxyubiquinone hydroxylase family protein [Pseudomonadales bacterium]